MMNNQTDDEPSVRYFNIYINLFYLIFGNIGNLLKIAFFLQTPLRSLPCTVYILFSTVSDIITLNNLPVLQLLIHLYPRYHWIKVSVDWSNYQNDTVLLSYSPSTQDVIICKIRSYLHMFSIDLSFQMLLFASINRFYSSYCRKKRQNTTHYLIRHFCHRRNVYRLCIISTIISALVSVQHVFNFTVISASKGCVPSNRIFWLVWVTIFQFFLLPILMMIFGILTLRNIHYLFVFGDYFPCKQSRRYQHRQRKHGFLEKCSHCQNSIQHKIEKQLTAMIISEICITILTSVPYGSYAFYQLIHRIQGQTVAHTNRTQWILLFVRLTMYFEPSCGFYIYVCTLHTMRKRFFQLIREKIPRINRRI